MREIAEGAGSGAASRQLRDEGTPLRIGVACGAGSAAAMAEMGALEVLAEAGLPVARIAGTSAGALVGAAFAAGRLRELQARLSGLSRSGVMRLFDLAWSREGFLQGRRALEFVRPELGETIEELGGRYAAVATDLRSGEEVALSRGPIFDAVRASIAIPGIFTPWRIEGRLLVDGGLVNPVPVSVARALGAEFVIALNVLPLPETARSPRSIRELLRLAMPAAPTAPAPTTLPREDEAPSLDERLGLVEVVWRASRILTSQIASTRLREDAPDWILQIPVPEVGMFDFHRTAELVEVGRRHAEAALPELKQALDRAVPLHRRLRSWTRRAGMRLPERRDTSL